MAGGSADGTMSPFKVFVSGVGFLSDAYVLFVINIVKNVLAVLYKKEEFSGALSSVGVSALAGAVLGQVVFGSLADSLGRRVIFVCTISLVCLGSIGSALCFSSPVLNIYYQLIFWQFLLGFGIGGEYPLSATVTSEGSEGASRGRNVSSVFAMQGVGNLLSSIVMYALLASPLHLDAVWRIALAFGAVPGLSTVYFRWQMGESKHFAKMQRVDNKASARSTEAQRLLSAPEGAAAAQAPMGTVAEEGGGLEQGARPGTYGGPVTPPALVSSASLVGAIGTMETGSPRTVREAPAPAPDLPGWRKTLAVIYEFRWVLLGTAGSWMLFDITFYANGLFSGTILEVIGIAGKPVAGVPPSQHDLAQIALTNIIITGIGLPGYIAAVACIDRIGRRNLQLLGFTMVAIVFLLMGAFLAPLEGHIKWLFIALYGLTFFFANFGPNTTTFVIPSESFPTRARATCHGLSAASGKMGAVIGGATLQPLLGAYGTSEAGTNEGLRLVLFVCAAVSLLGTAWTWVFTVDKGSANLADLDKDTAAANPTEAALYDSVVTPGGFSIPDLSRGGVSDLGDSGSVLSDGSNASKKYGAGRRAVNTPDGGMPLLAGSPDAKQWKSGPQAGGTLPAGSLP